MPLEELSLGNKTDYLSPNEEMDILHPVIQETAFRLSQGCQNNQEKVIKIFYFIRDGILYNMYPKNTDHENYYASSVLKNGEGWCLQKSLLMVTLLRAVRIPARLCFAELINHALGEKAYEAIGTNHFSPHTFVEVFLNQNWIPVTPIFDAPLCEKLEVPTVEFDGVHPAMLSPVDLKGNPYIQYLSKTHGYEAIPWDYVFSEIQRVYHDKATIWFSKEFMQEGAKKKK